MTQPTNYRAVLEQALGALGEADKALRSIKQEAETGLVIGDEIGMRDALEQVLKDADEYFGISTHPQASEPKKSSYTTALEIRASQGWNLTGKAIPVLHTDTINGEQVCRDDVWLCTTDALRSKASEPAPSTAGAIWQARDKGFGSWEEIDSEYADGMRKLGYEVRVLYTHPQANEPDQATPLPQPQDERGAWKFTNIQSGYTESSDDPDLHKGDELWMRESLSRVNRGELARRLADLLDSSADRTLGIKPIQEKPWCGHADLRQAASLLRVAVFQEVNRCQHRWEHSAKLGGKICSLCGIQPEAAALLEAQPKREPLTDEQIAKLEYAAREQPGIYSPVKLARLVYGDAHKIGGQG